MVEIIEKTESLDGWYLVLSNGMQMIGKPVNEVGPMPAGAPIRFRPIYALDQHLTGEGDHMTVRFVVGTMFNLPSVDTLMIPAHSVFKPLAELTKQERRMLAHAVAKGEQQIMANRAAVAGIAFPGAKPQKVGG